MGKRRKIKMAARRELTLEEQLAELEENRPPGMTPKMDGGYWGPSPELADYVRKHTALMRAIRERDAKLLADPGPDEGGRYSPTPASSRGHVVEVAPQKMRVSKDSAFPKRIATQRMIDRYFRANHINAKEWKAADSLWQLWCRAGLNTRVTAAYEGFIAEAANNDGPFAARSEAAQTYLAAMSAVPYRCRGVVIHVVVCDWSASSWAVMRGKGRSDSEWYGLDRLRAGIAGLIGFFRY